MKFFPTPKFKRQLKKKLKQNPSLQTKISRQLNLLLLNPQHPSLKLHKLKGKRIDQFSIWIENDLRITFLIEGDNYILTDLITHDEY